MSKIEFPDYDEDFSEFEQLDPQEMADAIRNLRLCIEKIRKKRGNIPKNVIEFIEGDMPNCCRTVVLKSISSKIVNVEFSAFCDSFISFIVDFSMPPKLLQVICDGLQVMRRYSRKTSPAKLKKDERAKILKFNNNEDFIRNEKISTTLNAMNLLYGLLNDGLLSEMKKEINKEILNGEQFTVLINILNNISGFITDKYNTVIVQLLCDAAIRILREESSNAKTICSFFMKYLDFFHDKINEIIEVLCYIEGDESISVKYQSVNCLANVIKTKGSEKSADIIKDALFNAAKSDNVSLYQLALQILPRVLKNTDVTLEDLVELVQDASKVDGIGHLMLVDEFLNKVKIPERSSSSSSEEEYYEEEEEEEGEEEEEEKLYDMDSFAEEYLSINKIYPPLNSKLIDKVSKEPLRNQLFESMIENPEVLKQTDFSKMASSQRITKRIKKASQESNDPTVLLSLSYFFLNNLQIKSFDIYMERLITKAKRQDALVEALNNFTSMLNDFDSDEAYLTLLQECLKLAKKEKNEHHVALMFDVLCNWTEVLNDFPVDEVLERIEKTKYKVFPDEFPSFLEKFIANLDDREEEIAPLLMNFVETTIPVQHSKWLTQTLFRYIYTSEELLEDFVGIIMEQMKDEEKREHAIALLDAACCIEADFFRINDEFGFTQKVVFLVQDEKLEGQISLHPYHSARRVYHYAQTLIENSKYVKENFDGKIELGNFILTTNDGLSDNIFRFNSPPSTLELNSSNVLVFKVSFKKSEKNFFNVSDIIGNDYNLVKETKFLNKFATQENVSAIFSMLKEESELNQKLVLIMELFDPIKSNFKLHKSNKTLQMILTESVSDVLPYINMPRLFAYVLKAFNGALSEEELHTIINTMIKTPLDTVTSAMACKVLSEFEATVKLNSSELQHCFLDCDSMLVRKAIVHLIDPETPKENFISLLVLTKEEKYRSKTEEFFQCISKFDVPKQHYIDLYNDLEQFEFSHYSDIDQTFIGLMKLLPHEESVILLTLKRLYTPPDCSNLNKPFVHTLESWEAALDFLKDEKAIPMVLSRLEDLPTAPSAETTLNDDFTYKGTLGIKNLGATCYLSAILQCFVAMPHIKKRLFNTDPELLTPYLQELRMIIAKLSYQRCGDVSISSLVEQDKSFNPYNQQDAEEEFNKILNIMKDDVDKSIDLVGPITGKTEISDVYNSQTIKTVTEPFMILQLTINDKSNIYQAFECTMAPQKIEDYDIQDGIKGTVLRYQKIVDWPDYLSLHLTRWNYSVADMTKKKLTHELDFPLVLQGDVLKKTTGSDPCCNYSLSAIIVHSGNAEQGHYRAIVEGDDKDWYLCDDTEIGYFSAGQIPSWSFGGKASAFEEEEDSDEEGANDNDILTAYILIYKRKDIEAVDNSVPADIEEKFDKINANMWPMEIFYSEKFVDFVCDLLTNHSDDEKVIELAVISLFKILIVDEGKLQTAYKLFIDNVLTNRERCLLFFDIIERRINKSLSMLFSLSDASHILGLLINHALQMIDDTTKALSILLKNIDISQGKRPLVWCFEFISTSLKTLQVDWANEEDVLMLIVQYIVHDSAKELQKTNAKEFMEAFSLTSLILNEIVENRGINDAVLILFDHNNFIQLASFAKKCEAFIPLLATTFTQMPTLYDEIVKNVEDNKDVENLFNIAKAHGISLGEKMPDANYDFLFDCIPDLLFNESPVVRSLISRQFLRILKPIDPKLENYLNNSIFQKNIPKPNFSDGSSTVSYFIGLIPTVHKLIVDENNEEICGDALQILAKCSKLAPKTISFFTKALSDCIPLLKDTENIEQILTIVHSICAFNGEEIIDQMSEEAIGFILSHSKATNESIQILFIFRSFANETELLSACIERALSEKMTAFGRIVIEIVSECLTGNGFNIPKESPGIGNIKLAVLLLERSKEKKDEIIDYIVSCLKFAKPFSLYEKTETVSKAIEILQKLAPEKLNL